MHTEKHVLVKSVCKWAKHGSNIISKSQKKTDDGKETSWLSSKETVLGAAVNKEGHVDSFLGQKRIHHNWFPKKNFNCK